ncbi:bifunctional Armadillo-like helical/E3 ubiquitin-protein ligase listerin/Listerin [Babesia duncani]|uniref:E3 ubiquitin-protein ligase listerin n=1 Tax=Babesia duncani TaxID=323732 RepID=A0AAD9PN56_9APIC|nr:bifunctional Armadillo-like helical/E3 ubiquitin-protein ligase listerin/Listerin [Babesia duncani]
MEYAMQIRSPSDSYKLMCETGIKKFKCPFYVLLLKAIIAGWFVGMAGHAGLVLASAFYPKVLETGTTGASKLAFGCIFSGALVLIGFTGADLFTGNTMYLTICLYERKVSILCYLSRMGISLIGNYTGTLISAGVISGGTGYFMKGIGHGGKYLQDLAAAKVALPFWRIMCSAIGCNCYVCLAVWSTFVCVDSAGNILAQMLLITSFAVAGYEHIIANFYTLHAAWISSTGITLYEMYIVNFIPTLLGNFIAGSMVIGAPLFLLYTETLTFMKKDQEPKESSGPRSFHFSNYQTQAAKGVGLSFIFDSFNTNAEGDDSCDSESRQELQQLLAKLTKRDSTTRQKALDTLLVVLDEVSVEVIESQMLEFLTIFKRLVLVEPMKKVRHQLSRVLGIIVKKLHRKITKFMPILLPWWWIAMHDDYKQAAESYRDAFNETFGAKSPRDVNRKHLRILGFYIENISSEYHYILSTSIAQFKHDWIDVFGKTCETHVTALEMHNRLVTATFDSMTHLLDLARCNPMQGPQTVSGEPPDSTNAINVRAFANVDFVKLISTFCTRDSFRQCQGGLQVLVQMVKILGNQDEKLVSVCMEIGLDSMSRHAHDEFLLLQAMRLVVVCCVHLQWTRESLNILKSLLPKTLTHIKGHVSTRTDLYLLYSCILTHVPREWLMDASICIKIANLLNDAMESEIETMPMKFVNCDIQMYYRLGASILCCLYKLLLQAHDLRLCRQLASLPMERLLGMDSLVKIVLLHRLPSIFAEFVFEFTELESDPVTCDAICQSLQKHHGHCLVASIYYHLSQYKGNHMHPLKIFAEHQLPPLLEKFTRCTLPKLTLEYLGGNHQLKRLEIDQWIDILKRVPIAPQDEVVEPLQEQLDKLAMSNVAEAFIDFYDTFYQIFKALPNAGNCIKETNIVSLCLKARVTNAASLELAKRILTLDLKWSNFELRVIYDFIEHCGQEIAPHLSSEMIQLGINAVGRDSRLIALILSMADAQRPGTRERRALLRAVLQLTHESSVLDPTDATDGFEKGVDGPLLRNFFCVYCLAILECGSVGIKELVLLTIEIQCHLKDPNAALEQLNGALDKLPRDSESPECISSRMLKLLEDTPLEPTRQLRRAIDLMALLKRPLVYSRVAELQDMLWNFNLDMCAPELVTTFIECWIHKDQSYNLTRLAQVVATFPQPMALLLDYIDCIATLTFTTTCEVMEAVAKFGDIVDLMGQNPMDPVDAMQLLERIKSHYTTNWFAGYFTLPIFKALGQCPGSIITSARVASGDAVCDSSILRLNRILEASAAVRAGHLQPLEHLLNLQLDPSEGVAFCFWFYVARLELFRALASRDNLGADLEALLNRTNHIWLARAVIWCHDNLDYGPNRFLLAQLLEFGLECNIIKLQSIDKPCSASSFTRSALNEYKDILREVLSNQKQELENVLLLEDHLVLVILVHLVLDFGGDAIVACAKAFLIRIALARVHDAYSLGLLATLWKAPGFSKHMVSTSQNIYKRLIRPECVMLSGAFLSKWFQGFGINSNVNLNLPELYCCGAELANVKIDLDEIDNARLNLGHRIRVLYLVLAFGPHVGLLLFDIFKFDLNGDQLLKCLYAWQTVLLCLENLMTSCHLRPESFLYWLLLSTPQVAACAWELIRGEIEIGAKLNALEIHWWLECDFPVHLLDAPREWACSSAIAALTASLFRLVGETCIDNLPVKELLQKVSRLFPGQVNVAAARFPDAPLRGRLDHLFKHEIRRCIIAQDLEHSSRIRTDSLKVFPDQDLRTIRVTLSTRAEVPIEIMVKIPQTFPLEPLAFIMPDASKFRSKLHRWLMLAQTESNTRGIAQGLFLWQNNVSQLFDGLEECPICYSIVHLQFYTIPNKNCKVCKHKFHGDCLLKWFRNAPKPKCPLCQSTASFSL